MSVSSCYKESPVNNQVTKEALYQHAAAAVETNSHLKKSALFNVQI